MTKKYVAHITQKTKAATNRISDKSELNIKVQVFKLGRGTGKFVFTRGTKQKLQQQDLFQTDDPEQPQKIPHEIMEQIPELWRDDSLDAASKRVKESEAGELEECIVFVNDAITRGTQIKSYGAYLWKSYKGGWHKQAKVTKEADGKAKAQAEKAVQAREDADQAVQAKLDTERSERDRITKEQNEDIGALAADQLAALYSFIEKQNLNKISRQQLDRGVRDVLRRRFIQEFKALTQ